MIKQNHQSSQLVLTTQQVAELLAIPVPTLRRWAGAAGGPLRPIRIGRLVRYRAADLAALVEGRPARRPGRPTKAEALARQRGGQE